MNLFHIAIPVLPPFTTPRVPSTPRENSRKWRTLEDHHSPAKWIHENAQRESSALAKTPLVPLEYPRQPPLSPSKRNNHLGDWAHPTPPLPPFCTSTLPSTGTLEGHSKHCCQVCNSEDILEVPTESPPPRLDYVASMEIVLGILWAHGLMLGDFIMTVLNPETSFMLEINAEFNT